MREHIKILLRENLEEADLTVHSIDRVKDRLNRFSEEVGLPYRLILCSNNKEISDKFERGEGNLYLSKSLHDSLLITQGASQSFSIVQRNVAVNSRELMSVLRESYSYVNKMPSVFLNEFQSKIISPLCSPVNFNLRLSPWRSEGFLW